MKKVIFTLFILLVVKFVSAQCNASFIVGGTGQNIIFTNNSTTGHTKSFWDFGDGTFSNDNGLTVTHNYSKADYYLVRLVIFHASNNCHDDTTILVLAGNPTGLCKANFTQVVNGNQVTFTSTSNGSPNIHLWEFGDGSVSTLPNPVHTYTTGGFYKVRLRIFVTTMPVCMDAFEQVIKVGTNSDCRAFFNYFVKNDSVYFYDKSFGQNLANYKWNFGDGTISTDKNPVKKYSNAGFYDVCLSVSDNSYNCFNTGCRYVPINTNTTSVHAFFDYYVGSSRLVTFRDNSTGNPTDWHWDFGDGSTSNTENTSRMYFEDGYYLVHLRASNANSSSDFVQLIKVGSGDPGLKAKFAFLINNNYYPDASVPVDFKGSSLGDPSKIIWNYGDGTKDSSHGSPFHIYADTGKYNVCVTIKNRNTGQSDTYCNEIHVLAEGISEKPANNVTLFTSPNPISTTANISYFIPKSTEVSLIIFDLIGIKKEVLVDKNQAQGIYSIEWDRKTLPNGMYLLELKTSYGTIVNKLTIVE